ncbi:MAG TPA: helix-turn-helix domain-containing protein [Solirubrobacterales bacterium]|jgi:AcrR family transcriptional regulator|nr:TetR/AcrR family transcriptional regulator [Solirubrobacterales bacterium]HMU27432.1 helix-turn-helix domain-containing protein [Solirubrobacterales bacterium]HNA44862.1 helix-turn-helix domain-containing protein [Solirubrobacterales bacterium]HNC06126.1 helix-turn-helix domain-containing protein [Solirubrobacterales bacterium]HNC94376.1 helix-turn-helix domain-containing protein [Solirubrobacterales bacterium]
MTSAEKTEKTLRADARRNREKIFAAARELFARDAEGVQMEEIASHAGVGVGTIYRHFPTKQALLTEMVRTRFSRFTEIALEAERIDDPREAVETLIRQSCVEVEGDAGFQLAMMSPDELEWEGIEQEKAAFAEPATRIIDRAVESGAVRSDFSFADFPMLMCGITSTMYFAPAGSDWQRHLDLILAGLRPG